MMDAVIEELATKYQITGLSRNRIRGMIKTTTTSNTAAFTVQISSTDRELAFKVSKCFASLGNKIITERSEQSPLPKAARLSKRRFLNILPKTYDAQINAADFGENNLKETSLQR